MTATPEAAPKSDRVYAPTLRRSAPTEAAGYAAFADAALRNTAGEIPLKYRELIAIGVALAYLDFRFADLRWRDGHSRLAAWHATFDARASVVANPPVADR